jgi:hypothetical protein
MRQSAGPLTLRILGERFGIARMDPSAPWPEWLSQSGFSSITRTSEELSIVCEESLVPPGVKVEPGWGAIKIEGPLDFDLVGILSSIAGALADAGISLFAVSTFDTDYVMVRQERMESAIEALMRVGHRVVRPGSPPEIPRDGR